MKTENDDFGSREKAHQFSSFRIMETMKRRVEKKKGTREGEALCVARDEPGSRHVLFNAVVCVEQRPHSMSNALPLFLWRDAHIIMRLANFEKQRGGEH